jgi:3-hydroxyisobutyrate dehydrogenase-like beta-hydroxyacid dehydrogenase
MGKPMALNMLRFAGKLLACDLKAEALAELESAGADITRDVREAAKADGIFLCVPSSRVVESIFYGEQGILSLLRPGQTVVDFSTIKYATTLRLAADLEARGVRFLDAPISGMEARAKDATLTVMVGGNREVYEKMLPYLNSVGNKILYMGEVGNGQLTKLINQLLFDINAAALAEVLPMAVKMGLDPQKVGDVVNSGTGRSYASEFFIPKNLQGVYDEGYPLEEAYKDLVSAAELASERCIPLPVLGAATATYQTAMLQGHGKLAKGAMIKVYEKLLGVTFRAADHK